MPMQSPMKIKKTISRRRALIATHTLNLQCTQTHVLLALTHVGEDRQFSSGIRPDQVNSGKLDRQVSK